MAQILKGGEHGCYKILAQLVGANGLSYGQAGDSLAAGSTSNAYVMDFPVSANVAIPDATTIDFTGGDAWQQSYQYGINSLGSFDIQLENTDATMTALASGSLVDQTTNALWTEYSEDILSKGRPQMSLIIIHRIQSFDAATFGQTKFINTIIPRCWVQPKGPAGMNYQAKSTSSFRVTPTASALKINGASFGANINVTDNHVAWYHLITDNPLFMTVMIANGTSASIVGAYKPLYSAVGSASSTRNQISKYVGTTSTVGVADTVTTSTATFAVGSAVTCASGNYLSALYETAYIAP